MNYTEYSPLLFKSKEVNEQTNGNKLTVFFAVVCVVDIFGVLPIVALPKAIIQCGLLLGGLVVFLIFSTQIYAAILLGKCWLIAESLDNNIKTKTRYPYAAIAEIAFNKNVAKFVTILLDVTIFGAGIPNLILAAQNLQLFGLKVTDNNFNVSFCYWILLLGLIICPFLWFGSPKDMKIICFVSVIVVISITIIIWSCIINDNSNSTIDVFQKSDIWRNIVVLYGILAFQFDLHPILLTIQVDMKEKSKIPCVVIYGFLSNTILLVTAFLFLSTTILAYEKYGENISFNILDGLSSSLPVYIAVFLVAVQLCVSSVIVNNTLYQNIEELMNIPRDFNYKRCLIRFSLTALAVVIAESIPKFDLIMSLIGGTLTGPLAFIFPPLFYIRMVLLQRKNATNTCHNICSVQHYNYYNPNNNFFMISPILVVLFGIIATCITTYLNIIDAYNYISFAPPCLFNITVTNV